MVGIDIVEQCFVYFGGERKILMGLWFDKFIEMLDCVGDIICYFQLWEINWVYISGKEIYMDDGLFVLVYKERGFFYYIVFDIDNIIGMIN